MSTYFLNMETISCQSSVRNRSRCYRDTRTWRLRIERLHENWEPRFEEMLEAYLRWKYQSSQPADETGGETIEIRVIDIYSLQQMATITVLPTSRSVAESLTTNGYIGNGPERPSLAVSIRTLELFRRIRLRKASFSIEAFAKVVCDLYNVRFIFYSVNFVTIGL